MLELKNVFLSRGGQPLVSDLSFVVKEGEVVCVVGGHGAGKTSLLMAILGLRPVLKGYITLDGEWINVDSAESFRQKMGYLPRDLTFPQGTVEEYIETLTHLRGNRLSSFSQESLMKDWEKVGIDAAFLKRDIAAVEISVLRAIFLTVFLQMHKEVFLIDHPKSDMEWQLVRSLACQGSCVVATAIDVREGQYCDKQVVLNMEQ
ncbi:MAG TPA: ABC transporter [Prevotella sp.]|nr:ABC transporter [Prevotella sp.]